MQVRAAVRTKDGKIFTGVNVENASFSLTIYAERVDVFTALCEGHKSFTDFAIAPSLGEPTFPCGACIQVLLEFNPQIRVHLGDNGKKTFKLVELLPHGLKTKQIYSKK